MNTSLGKESSVKLTDMCDHNKFLNRIKKTLYYSKLPVTDCLSLPVTELATEIFTEVKHNHSLERLDMEEASKISRNACISPCSLVLALLYVERLKDRNPEYLQKVAPSELFLVSLMVASKFLNDDGEEDEVYNTEWAQSANLNVSEVNEMERNFLSAIDWSLFVHNKEFWERLQRLERDIASKEGQKRGWFSYTELSYLMNSVQLIEVAHILINVSTICLAIYTAGVATLFGSVLISNHLSNTLLNATQSKDIATTKICPSMDRIPLIQDESQNLDEVLSTDFIYTLLKFNEIWEKENDLLEDNNKRLNISWQWWLNSIMIRLSEYSNLQSHTELGMNYFDFENNTFFINNNKFLLNTTTIVTDTNNIVIDVC